MIFKSYAAFHLINTNVIYCTHTASHGCETWSSTLKEEHRLRVFENRVLRRIFGPKREEVVGDTKDCIMRSCITCTKKVIPGLN
jgi:hypothetical protein